MAEWVWTRLKAMHWSAKLLSVVFFVHVCVTLAYAYQLSHIVEPEFDELHRAEGRLVLVKSGRDWLTGIEHPDGSRELFSCQRPGSGGNKLCFMDVVIKEYKLDTKPDAVIWWYPMKVPLEVKTYPYIFQIQLKKDNSPFSFVGQLGNRIEISYKNRGDFSRDKSEGVRMKIGMALLYALGLVMVLLWDSYENQTRK